MDGWNSVDMLWYLSGLRRKRIYYHLFLFWQYLQSIQQTCITLFIHPKCIHIYKYKYTERHYGAYTIQTPIHWSITHRALHTHTHTHMHAHSSIHPYIYIGFDERRQRHYAIISNTPRNWLSTWGRLFWLKTTRLWGMYLVSHRHKPDPVGLEWWPAPLAPARSSWPGDTAPVSWLFDDCYCCLIPVFFSSSFRCFFSSRFLVGGIVSSPSRWANLSGGWECCGSRYSGIVCVFVSIVLHTSFRRHTSCTKPQIRRSHHY